MGGRVAAESDGAHAAEGVAYTGTAGATGAAGIDAAVATGRRLDSWRRAANEAFDMAMEVVPAASARPHLDRDHFGKRAIRVKESA